jgi:predicted PurR-regulated permease PerM
MVRNVGGFAAFGFLAMIAFKILGGIFGMLLGLVLTVLTWAFFGFVFYTLIKMFSPSTAENIRDTFRGERSAD